MPAAGRELEPEEAVAVFRRMPSAWQIASLHPTMVAVDAKKDALLRPVHWSYAAHDQCFLHSFQLGANPGLAVADIQSAYGYGGPLSTSDDPDFLAAAHQAFRRWAQEHGVVAEFLRFHPLVPQRRWYAGAVSPNRPTVQIDLSQDLFGQYQTRRRTDVRRFQDSGVRVEKVAAGPMRAVFPQLYRANMDQIGATPDYYFPAAYFDALFEFEATENWIAWQGDQALAGAAILASPTARVAEYHLGAKVADADRHRAMIGLLHAIAQHYQALSYQSFYLGGGRSTAADDSLLFFKKGFAPASGQFLTASTIYDTQRYAQLRCQLPDKAAGGRILFYKD